MEENNVVADNSNTAEDTAPQAVEEQATAQENAEETVEEIKSRLAKAEELARNYKIRAEKAEKGTKAPVQTPKNGPTVSTKDLYALIEAKVPEEDISEVEEFARFKGISISEALKSSTVKTLIAERREKREIASATNVGNTRRSPSKLSEDVLLDKARKGSMPESDDDIVRMIRARKGLK